MQKLPSTDDMTATLDPETQARVEQDVARVMNEIGPQSKVARALADIEAGKQGASPAVAQCLDSIADLIRETGDPDSVFDRVMEVIASEDVKAIASTHGIRLRRSTADAVDCGWITETCVFWPSGGQALAVFPHGQRPTVTLVQLQAAIAERDEEQRITADFQASAAAGHVEDVETWHARTAQAGK